MFVVLWEFDVKPGSETRFEKVYGPSGQWARLFQRDPAWRRTLLLRDPFRERKYVTCDFWTNQRAYEAFRRSHSNEYLVLDKDCEGLTVSEQEIGRFEQLDATG
jgi:hypothetical protein